MVNKIEKNIEKLIAYKLITSVTGSISDRAKRKYDALGKEVGEKFKGKQKIPEDSNLIAQLKWSDEAANYARRISLGMEEFRQEYPEYGKILDDIIEKHRESRRAYLEFGVKEGDLPEEIYLEVIKEVLPNLNEESARNFYNNLREINSSLKKKVKGLQKFLLPE